MEDLKPHQRGRRARADTTAAASFTRAVVGRTCTGHGYADAWRATRFHFAQCAPFDMRRVDKIYVHDRKEPGGFFIAKLTSRSERAAGLSVEEATHMHYMELTLKGSARHSKAQNTMEANRHKAAVQATAREKTKAAMQGRRRSSRRDNLVEARADAKNLERDRTAVPTSAPPAAPAPAPVPTAPAALADNNVISLRPAETPASAQSQQASPVHPLTPAERARRLRQQMMEGL